MSKSIYVNVPVKSVAAAREFYTKLGFAIKEELSNDQSAVVIINEQSLLMLVDEEFFKQNTKREVDDTKTVSEVSLAIEVANRGEVDRTIETAVASGGKLQGEPLEEYGMYSRGFTDLDGHRLDILCMTV